VTLDTAARRLVGAVLLSAVIGTVGGALGAWAMYAHFGPVQQVLNAPSAKGGAGTSDVVRNAQASIVTIATQPGDVSAVTQGTVQGAVEGVIASADGLIVTSAQALSGGTQLTVGFPDGTHANATVVAVDAVHGLAVLRAVDQKNLAALTFASAPPALGDPAVAVSQPLVGKSVVGVGNVSAVDVTATVGGTTTAGVVLIDAQPLASSIGAPVLGADGSAIGVVVTPTNVNELGALSGTAASALVSSVQSNAPTHASFGAASAPLAPGAAAAFGVPQGALVQALTPGGTAAQAGIQVGDLVTQVGSTPIGATHPFDAAALGLIPGKQVAVTLIRDGATVTLPLVVGTGA